MENRFEELPAEPTHPKKDQELISEPDDVFHESIEDPLELMISQANSLKDEGNSAFNRKRWQDALNKYSEALYTLPAPPPKKKINNTNNERDDESTDDLADSLEGKSPQVEKPDAKLENDMDLTQDLKLAVDPRVNDLRSVLNANSGACHLKLEDWRSAVDSCTAALNDKPNYSKALHRRAQANEKIGTWASLQASLDDYNYLAQLPNLPPQLIKEIKASQIRLPPMIAHRSELDKAEMMSKLKDLGNTVLGKFGMSTDNFKFTPNGSGGYSMAFQQ